jgi:hypothetical protein
MNDEKKIVGGKATVRPSGFMKKKMEDKEAEKTPMNFWSFLDKHINDIFGFIVTIIFLCGVFGVFYMLFNR